MSREIEELQAALRWFAEERDWGQFHSPKNLAASLSIEAAEVLEHFQWLTEAQSRQLDEPRRQAAATRSPTSFQYLLQLSDQLASTRYRPRGTSSNSTNAATRRSSPSAPVTGDALVQLKARSGDGRFDMTNSVQGET